MFLLDSSADIGWPGTTFYEGRTALGELCRHADPNTNPAYLKLALEILFNASTDLGFQVHGKSVLLLALDNGSALRMTRSPTPCTPDHACFHQSRRGYCYSLTMYVRFLKCEIQDFRDN